MHHKAHRQIGNVHHVECTRLDFPSKWEHHMYCIFRDVWVFDVWHTEQPDSLLFTQNKHVGSLAGWCLVKNKKWRTAVIRWPRDAKLSKTMKTKDLYELHTFSACMGRSPCVLTFLTGLSQIPVFTITFTWSVVLVKLIPLLHQYVAHHPNLTEFATHCSNTTTSPCHVSLPWHLTDHLNISSLDTSTVRARVQRALFPLSWWRFNVFLENT